MPVYPRNQRPLHAALAADRQRALEKAKMKAASAEKTEDGFGGRNDSKTRDNMEVVGTKKARKWLGSFHLTSKTSNENSKPRTSDYQSL
ncbi:uncharacterized protein CLUP02_01990 [Colletotrichum lupini]|uniref:Uncharacterized protein n=1 Tax=Colletotrichum lupini TaxID=145971 RepID=A0A9Q8W9T4_9PEZI|nr:uncharacterized protein CLUP02_01990 [Colletotrichum lupini]UQC75336.1 hypothetical protein CLUP02_01990 [Colletotrichum lupini]